MSTLLFALNMILQQTQGMVTRRYGKRHNFGGMFFNAVICLFAMVFFMVTDTGGLMFPKELWFYGILSSTMFATGFYAMFIAYNLGSFVLSNMISSFSGVITILYGIIFLREPAGFTTYTGIVLVFLSVALMQYRKSEGGDKKGFSFAWLVSALASAVSNGFIGIIQKEQQLRFSGAYDNEFMIISLGGAFLLLLVIVLFKEREALKASILPATLYGVVAGALNGAMNLVNLALISIMNLSVFTPMKTGVSFLLSFFISVVIYRERFTKLQLVSAGMGIVALIMFAL